MLKEFSVPVRDGTTIGVAVYAPDSPGTGAGRFPALLAPSPYRYDNNLLPAGPQFLWRETGPIELIRGVRRAMAQNMELATAEVASATIMDDADIDAWPRDASAVLRLIRALIAGCRAEPALNAWYDSEKVGRWVMKRIDIGIAVDTPDGLLVPVLRNCGGRGIEDLKPALEKLVAGKGLVPVKEMERRVDEWDAAARATPHGKPIELSRR